MSKSIMTSGSGDFELGTRESRTSTQTPNFTNFELIRSQSLMSSSSAAASAASTRRARSRGAPVRVTLLDRHNYHLFQPLLYQVATASLSPGGCRVADPVGSAPQKNVQVLLAEARSDRSDQRARHRRWPVDGGPDRDGRLPTTT